MPRSRLAAGVLSLVLIAGALAACSDSGSPGESTESALPGSPSPTGDVASVPISAQIDDGIPRLTMQLTVGGTPLIVLVDEGSSGLYLDASAVGAGVTPSGQTVSVHYVSGTVTATVATASVTIGDVTTTQPIALGLIDSATAAGTLSGLQGIIGVAQNKGSGAPSGIYSPLAQLPAPYDQGVQIDVPAGGNGTLQLGKPATTSTTVALPLTAEAPLASAPGVPFWNPNVTMCWTLGTLAPTCGPTVLDSGAPRTTATPSVASGLPVTSGVLDPGQPVAAAAPDGTPLWSFTTGTTVGQDVVAVEQLPTGTNYLTGIAFYYSHVVGFDYVAGTVLVTPRS